MFIILSVTGLTVRVIIVLNFQYIVKSLLVFIVIVLTVKNWVNTGDALLKIAIFLCKSQCGRCSICNEMSHIFVKLQDVYFFQPNVTCRSASDEKPLQPVMWRIFNRNISKNNNSFDIEIAKSIPHIGILTNYAKTC